MSEIKVISLTDSVSRRNYILHHLCSLGVIFKFVNASTPHSMPVYKQNTAIAIWDSHIRAMVEFLNSKEDCCLIFEDDVDLEINIEIKKNVLFNLDSIMKCLPTGYSIFQFGNMGFKNQGLSSSLMRDLFVFAFKRHHFDRYPYKKLKKSLGRMRYKKLQKDLWRLIGMRAKPLEGFTTGAQAYMINRSAAKFLIQNYSAKTDWDIKSRYSLDTFLEIASNSPNPPAEIRTIRLPKSIFEQRPVATTNIHYPS